MATDTTVTATTSGPVADTEPFPITDAERALAEAWPDTYLLPAEAKPTKASSKG